MIERPSDALLEERLGYRFIDQRLLKTALTHPSVGDGVRSKDEEANGRLEFLGDAFLGLVVADVLFERNPPLDEGALTKGREAFVKNARVREVGGRLELGPWLYLGGAETHDEGRGEPKRLGDALEAIIGAIYRDAGPAHATKVVRKLLERYTDLGTPPPK